MFTGRSYDLFFSTTNPVRLKPGLVADKQARVQLVHSQLQVVEVPLRLTEILTSVGVSHAEMTESLENPTSKPFTWVGGAWRRCL